MNAQPTLNRLGHSGLVVSQVGLGCNNFGRANTHTEDLAGTTEVVQSAIDAGITLFDTADINGKQAGLSEELLGKALGRQRDQVVIATKFGMDTAGANGPDAAARGSRKYIVQSVEASLRRLGTDWIDLYQLHTPDPQTPIEETLLALDDLVRSGKVRYLGHSNFSGWQVAQAHYVAKDLGTHRFISSQNHYNLLDRRAELEITPAAQEFGLGVLPYFPLANGLLTGKYRSTTQAPADGRLSHTKPQILQQAPWKALETYFALAESLDLTPLQLTFSWLASQPTVASVIAGATRQEQVVQNATAVHALDAATLQQIDAIFAPAERIALF